jgi:hypothetical protein
MAFALNDRVKETSTSIGTAGIVLDGAATGFETFSSAIGNGNVTYYAIVSQNNAEFEVGVGRWALERYPGTRLSLVLTVMH